MGVMLPKIPTTSKCNTKYLETQSVELLVYYAN